MGAGERCRRGEQEKEVGGEQERETGYWSKRNHDNHQLYSKAWLLETRQNKPEVGSRRGRIDTVIVGVV